MVRLQGRNEAACVGVDGLIYVPEHFSDLSCRLPVRWLRAEGVIRQESEFGVNGVRQRDPAVSSVAPDFALEDRDVSTVISLYCKG